MGVLDDILVGVRADLAERVSARPLPDLMDAVAALPPTRDPMPAFRAPELAVIAEVKRASPPKGDLHPNPNPARLAAT